MLALNFADWAFWEAYSPPSYLGEQKVTFDGPNRLILINDDVTEIDFRVDVYSGWKEWVQDPHHNNAKWPEAIAVIGGDPLPGARVLGTTYFLENGWRMRTWEGNHALTVAGNVFTREGDSLFVDTLLPWTITINLNTSTLVETIVPEGQISLGTGDIQAISANVWAQVISGITAENRLIAIDTATANTANSVWDHVVDTNRNQTAEEKLRKIATKTQDIALGD